MEFNGADVRMLAVIVFSLLGIAQRCLGSDNIDELLKLHPTWSFEVESVDSFIKNVLHEHSLKGHDFQLTEKDLRKKVIRNLPPDATHIVRKVGDPKWESDPTKVPASFDAREKWKKCASLMTQVEDEGPCHTDSPAVIASVITDRYCIYTNGTETEKLSQEVLMGCRELCTSDPFPFNSWYYAKTVGIPTGGAHGSGQGCVPYSYPACDHASYYGLVGLGRGKKKMGECKGSLIFDHDCPDKCTNKKYKTPIDKDRKQLTTFYVISPDEFVVRNEIMNYGPVVTSVVLFDDFLKKPDGIFQRSSKRKVLAEEKFFKIIGWGRENGIKYWLCVHTWDTWGDKVFKFPRGENYDFVEFIVTTGVFEEME